MKRLVFVTLIIFLNILFSYNAFAFTFVDEGFPKEPDHNRKWIMIKVGSTKYYFETAKEIDLEALGRNGYICFDKDLLNNGKSIYIYDYDEINGMWKYRIISKQIIETGTDYKILYTNYNISGEFNVIGPYMRYIKNCVNVSDILAFCIMMFAVLISFNYIRKSGCSL